MEDSNSKPDKTNGSTCVADSEVPCECVFVCICESKNAAPDTQKSDYIKAAKRAGLTYKHKYIMDVPDIDKYVFASRLYKYFLFKRNVQDFDRAHNLHMKYYDQILQIYLKLCSTDKELNNEDFIEITNMLETFNKKGLMPDNIFSNFKKAINENGYIIPEIDEVSSSISEVRMEESHQKCDGPRYFNTAANKFYSNESMKSEIIGEIIDSKNVFIRGVIFAKIMEPFEKYDSITSRGSILNSLEFTVVMSDLSLFIEEGWLCQYDLSRYIEVDKLAADIIKRKDVIREQLKNPLKRILDSLKVKPNGEIKYDVEYRELPMEYANWELIGQKVCLSLHNTPFCEMCGLQSSWLNTFKKRGINIKEAESYNSKHIWNNNSKE